MQIPRNGRMLGSPLSGVARLSLWRGVPLVRRVFRRLPGEATPPRSAPEGVTWDTSTKVGPRRANDRPRDPQEASPVSTENLPGDGGA